MTTLVQEFLRSGGTLADLAERYAVKAVPGVRYPNLVTLKYSQIASPLGEPLVRECRGIVLDRDDDWRCAARGFDKFFNYGEPNAAAIDWSTATVQEKLDGSLMMLYWYDGAWRVATTGHPEAGGDVWGHRGTFADLFWETQGGRVPGDLPRHRTYAFELCSVYNRVVVRHPEPRLALLAIREPSGKECSPKTTEYWAFACDVDPVRAFPLQSFEDIAATFTALDPLQQEGYVVVDAARNRVKVKHPGYVALHHLRYATSTRSLVDVCRKGETLELLAAFPELQSELDAIRDRFDDYAATIELDYASVRHVEDRKAFAGEAMKTTCAGAMFALRDGKAATAREYLAGVHLDGLMRSLGLKDRAAVEASA